AAVQVFIDDRQVAETQVGDDGRWMVKSLRRTPAGVYTLRVDEVQGDGNLVAQLSLPLRKGEDRAAAPPAPFEPAAAPLPGPRLPSVQRPQPLPPREPARPARPITLAGPDAVEPAGRSVELTVNKSRLVRLSTEARDVLVGNPQIADVVVRTPTVVYVLGK